MNTENDWQAEIRALIRKAEREESRGNLEKAVARYEEALDLIPEPREESVYATQLLTAIGEQYFLNGRHDEAFEAFSQAVRCKGGLGLSHIHLRLGQLRYGRGEMVRAKDELMRAYMGSGRLVFEGEDPKYYELIRGDVERERP